MGKWRGKEGTNVWGRSGTCQRDDGELVCENGRLKEADDVEENDGKGRVQKIWGKEGKTGIVKTENVRGSVQSIVKQDEMRVME